MEFVRGTVPVLCVVWLVSGLFGSVFTQSISPVVGDWDFAVTGEGEAEGSEESEASDVGRGLRNGRWFVCCANVALRNVVRTFSGDVARMSLGP